ncbi:unnamed protein product [Clavelina lepadiformis]|uniref:EF-hand domain-containing protein n=1 Tax=Clavelina lepadiformis TaxID=159417 RepID=A0ABP0FR13_CLALP
MAYPGYGAPNAEAPQMTADPLWPYYSRCAGQDGQIDVTELHRALAAANLDGTMDFSEEACRKFIAMLDRDYSGKMGFSEFKELWNAVNSWRKSFSKFDRNRSGTIDASELKSALQELGYSLPDNLITLAIRKFNMKGKSTFPFSDFVSCVLSLRALTDQFRSRDTARNGTAEFNYDDFIQVLMSS